ncbi:globin family protein [Aneurinibacillus sp. REN35]|uniref:hypothetical protein n=1 Tax=Aneurinibacillus sp. REN35 TaxID=3237286 RepID=UPI0035295C0C
MKSEQKEQLLDHIVQRIYEIYPDLEEKYGERGKQKCREDSEHHFHHLATAYEMDNDQFFIDYTLWLNNVLTSRGMNPSHIISNYQILQDVLCDILPYKQEQAYKRMLANAIQTLEKLV